MFLVKMGEKFDGFARRNIPDPLSIALMLTVVLAFIALVLTGSGPVGVVQAWSKGFWGFLGFSMQVSLSMVAGAVIFNAPAVKKVMARLCSIPQTSRQAGIFLFAAVFILLWLNWGIGFISVPFLTKEVAIQLNKKNVPYHLPFLAAAAFAGNVSYGGSWNSAALILVGTPGNFAEEAMGLVPLAQAVLSNINIIALVALFVVGIIIFYFLSPVDTSKFVMSDFGEGDAEATAKTAQPPAKPTTFAEKFDNIWIWGVFLVIFWAIWFYMLMRDVGLNAINLDVANITLIVFGILLWKYPLSYYKSFREYTPAAASVMLQFHFYAGIMGIMRYTGLVEVVSDAFAAISNATIYPVMAYLATGVINFAIPSGGGGWAAQGAVLVTTAQQLGSDLFLTTMAYCHADAIFNLFLPFWMLPTAAILKLQVRDIMGYTAAAGVFLVLTAITTIGLAAYGILPVR